MLLEPLVSRNYASEMEKLITLQCFRPTLPWEIWVFEEMQPLLTDWRMEEAGPDF